MNDLVNSNKNIWLAISLSVITSITSLGTAFISKDYSSPDQKLEKRLEKIEKDVKDLKKINKDLHRLIVIAVDKVNNL